MSGVAVGGAERAVLHLLNRLMSLPIAPVSRLALYGACRLLGVGKTSTVSVRHTIHGVGNGVGLTGLSVAGLGLRTDTKLFIGWFGPRGLASIVFAVMVGGEGLPGGDVVVATASWTILFSVIAHGLSANPLASVYGARVKDGPV